MDNAFEALKTYDCGADRNALNPIDEAIVATYGDAAKRLEIENRLIEALKSDVKLPAKQFLCRKLKTMGTKASVPALAELLADAKLSHMARYALERIDAAEAAKAMCAALPKLPAELQVGVLGSLGAREEDANVGAIAGMLKSSNAAVARAAAIALGAIGTPAAAKALAGAKPTIDVIDASFKCAEGLIAAGKKSDAKAIYMKFMSGDQPKHVKLAAQRGMLASA